MSRCIAYNQKGRPCCNYGRVLSRTDDAITYAPTCHIHKNFFKSEENVLSWKIFIQFKLFRYSSIYDCYFSKRNILHILLAALESGTISLKKSDWLVKRIKTCEERGDGSNYVTSKIAPYLKRG